MSVTSPRLSAPWQDPQAAEVYAAEQDAQVDFIDTHVELCGDEELLEVPAGELVWFSAQALRDAGWGDGVPRFALDVPDDSDLTGMHEGATQVVHLNRRLLSRWTVLHELAHW